MKILKRGSVGEDVKALQKSLKIYPDGIFGPLTEEAVKAFQKAHKLYPDGIVGAKTHAALVDAETSKSYGLDKSKRSIDKIIVHCTATPEGKDFSVATIRQWHLQRGFSDIGYHYVVARDGSVLNGRDVNISGAHCSGQNSHSIGVTYVGGLDKDGVPKDTRTLAQVRALHDLLVDLKALYPDAKIYGHRDFANKACPCFDAKKEYSAL